MSHSDLVRAECDFNLTAEQLCALVNFDRRNDEDLLAQLNSPQVGGVEGLCRQLRTHPVKGLALESTSAELVIDQAKRQEVFGENVVELPPSPSLFELVWGTIKEDPIIKILLGGALVTLVVGTSLHPQEGWIDGLAIMIAVVIVLSVTAGNDYSKDKKFRNLLLLQTDKRVKVLRSSKQWQISSWNLLVGDVVELSTGDEVPADGLVIQSNHMAIDESPLTGETSPVRKSGIHPFLFSGCQVTEGAGTMLVTGVGIHSCAGQIQALLSEKQSEQTPLQEKLETVAEQIGKLGISAGILTFFGLLVRWGADYSINHLSWTNDMILDLVGFFVVGVTIVVVAVPEGLPLAVTISLAFSMQKMIKDHCFVRHLAAAEVMGDATCICTDKTGTLTENRMTCVKLTTFDHTFHGEGSGEPDSKPFQPQLLPNQTMADILCEAIAANSTCYLKKGTGSGGPVFVGSATEGALLVLCEKIGCNYETIRSNITIIPSGCLEFDSRFKRMITTVQNACPLKGIANSPYRVHCKGASEVVLKMCKFRLDWKSNLAGIIPLDEQQRSIIDENIKSWASQGLRTIVLAFKNLHEEVQLDHETGKPLDLDESLVFLALVGIKDPIRKEVPMAVAKCRRAGLVVRMVTGDNVLTATTIARECGILDTTGVVLEGRQFRSMTKEQQIEVLPKMRVLARSSPADKLLRSLGEVVAVTGDGTNDAPALKEADVGFAMGIAGTQIALNACDVILLDDNFSSIVQAAKWGRNVLDVIRKFVQFQLAVNISAIIIIFFGSVATSHASSPMTPVQLLWINLIMDSLGALALASEEPEPEILNRPPNRRTESLITKRMSQYIAMVVLYEVCLTMYVLTSGYRVVGASDDDLDLIHTLVFTTFVIMQVANEVLARQLNHEVAIWKDITKNPLFLGLLISICLIQVLAVEVGSAFINTKPLSGVQWAGCLILGFGLIPFVCCGRLIFQHYEKRRSYSLVKPLVTSSLPSVVKSNLCN